MKSTATLSSRLLLVLGITIPTLFLFTSSRASAYNTQALEANSIQSHVDFTPNLAHKMDVMRSTAIIAMQKGPWSFMQSLGRLKNPDIEHYNGSLELSKSPAQSNSSTSAVVAFRSLNSLT